MKKMLLTFCCRNCLNRYGYRSLQIKYPLNIIYRKCNYQDKKQRLIRLPNASQVNCFFSTSSVANNLHTTKNWKAIAKTGQKKKEKHDTYEPSVSCEDGSDAFHHSDLLYELQNCKTVPEQIEKFCSLISITSEDKERRKQFCNSLAEDFRPYFSKFKLHQFGSSVNGLGFKGCDTDVSIQTIFDGQDYLKDVKEVPKLDSIIHGTVSADTVARLPSYILLRLVRRILRKHCPDVREPILLIKARCPILRFYNAKYDVYCDFSCENAFSLCNTKLMKLICLLDKRFEALTKLIRYWGKYGGFVGDIDLFNSYAFSLLVVHFLQQTHPPVLPPISEIIHKSEYLIHGEVNDDEMLLKDLKNFQPPKNSQSVEQLLRDFFFYYLNFDYSYMMMPFSSSVMPKTSFTLSTDDTKEPFEFSTVTVQDPFRLNFNTTHGAVFKACRKFLNGIVETCKVYQDETVWNPNAEMWGICSIFQKPMSDHQILNEWQKNLIHTIKLPLQTKSTLVKEILTECLLFHCKELYIPEEELGPKPSLRLRCHAYQNTWQGRDWIHRKCPPSLTDTVEIEKWVSKEVLKCRGDERKQLHFTVLCEFYENTSGDELVLSFKDSKCAPIVAVFLKDYIPYMCNKLII